MPPTLLQPRQINMASFGFRAARRLTAQAVPNVTDTPLVYDTVDYNTYGASLYSLATSDRFTAPVTGRYLVFAGLTWTPGAGSRRYVRAQYTATSPLPLFQNELPPAVGCYVSHAASTVFYLNANDVVLMFCYQDSGGSLNTFLGPGGYSSWGCDYLGP